MYAYRWVDAQTAIAEFKEKAISHVEKYFTENYEADIKVRINVNIYIRLYRLTAI